MKPTAKLGLILVALAITGCNISDKGTKTISQGGSSGSNSRTRWSTSAFPLNVKVATDLVSNELAALSPNELDTIKDLQDEWEANVSYNFFNDTVTTTTPVSTTDLSTYRDGVLGIYRSTSWFSNVTSNAIAITQWYGYNTSDSKGAYTEMVHADIIINARDWSFKTASDSTARYFIQQVILHELGHFIGLNHLSPPSGQDAVMKPYMDTDEHLSALQATDIDGVVDLYSNISLSAGIGARALGASAKSKNVDESDIVRGVIELHADGQCVHKVNDRIVYSHQRSLDRSIFERKPASK